MRIYAFLRQPSEGMVDVIVLTKELRAAGLPVASCTVSHSSEPYVVYVNAERALTPEERAAVEQVVQAHRATPQSAGA